jgi:hypothetical protein
MCTRTRTSTASCWPAGWAPRSATRSWRRSGRARREAARRPPRVLEPRRDEETRLLELISPAGFESYFAEIAPLLTGDGPPDIEALGRAQERHALRMDMSTIEPLVERHGLNG